MLNYKSTPMQTPPYLVSPIGFPEGAASVFRQMQENEASLANVDLARAKWQQTQADKERVFGGMFPVGGGFQRPGQPQQQSERGDAPAAPAGRGDMMSQILAALGGVGGGASRPFQGTTSTNTNIADVGSVSTEGTMPYEIAALNAGTTSQGNVLDLMAKLFGTQGGIETARIGAGAQMHGQDTGLEGTKYGADANTKQAQIAADAARAVAETNQTPARLQSEWRNSQIGNLLGARSRPSANGDGTDVTPVMSPRRDGGLGAIIKKLLTS